jgi:Protein of unknown function (DUF2845)
MNRCCLLLGALTALLLVSLPAQALRCDGRVIDEGDHAIRVRERCGDPYWVDVYSEWLIAGEYSPLEQRVERRLEAWYYNFGPKKLLRRMLFRDSRLIREDTLGYGVSRIGDRCDVDSIPQGTTTGEVVARCGEPASHESRYGDITQRDDVGNARLVVVRREEWVYDVGRSRDLRLLVFSDGILSKVERLER